MASTYSTLLRLELMGTGDQSGTWGNTTNTNLGTLLEKSIAGMATVVHSDAASYTMTANNGADDEARCMILKITGALSAARNVVCPTSSKTYWVHNATSGGFAVTLKTSGGTGISIANGGKALLYCDGTNVLDSLDPTLAALAALVTAADKMIYATGVDTFATTDLTSFARTLLDDAAATNARTTLGVAIGTDVQAFDAELAAIAGLTSAANKLPYFTGSGTAGVTDFTAFARTVLDDADAATARATLAAVALGDTNVWTGTNSFTNTLTGTKEVILSGVLSPAQIAANQTDYAPAGHATAFEFRLDLDASRTINSLAGNVAGRVIVIHNISAFTLTLLHDDGATGTAAMRFSNVNTDDLAIVAGGSVTLQYDAVSSRWRPTQVWTTPAGQASMEAASTAAQFVVPLRQHNHPGHPKSWGMVSVSGGSPTMETNYNMTSITDTGLGRLTCTLATDHSTANYCICATGVAVIAGGSVGDNWRLVSIEPTPAAGSFILQCFDASGNMRDPKTWNFFTLGDQ